MAKIDSFLQYLVQNEGSDLHLSCGDVPIVRIHGHVHRVKYATLTAQELEGLLFEILTPEALAFRRPPTGGQLGLFDSEVS